jgi:deoxycytidylate deaminase
MMATKSPMKREILNQSMVVAMSSPSKKKMGAILLKKKKVVAASCNYDKKSHPVQYWWAQKTAELYGKDFSEKVFIHAEIGAMVKSKSDADTIVVCRVGGHSGDELRNARPCKICASYLMYSNIKHVHYSTDNGFVYEYWG